MVCNFQNSKTKKFVKSGLLCVSTKVGGVPEVLPPHLVKLAQPTAEDLIIKVKEAILEVNKFDRHEAHISVKSMYSWIDVAQRTEIVYDRLLCEEKVPLIERLRRFYACGIWAGKIFCMVVAFAFLIWQFIEWWSPRENIDVCPEFDYRKFQRHLKTQTEEKLDSMTSIRLDPLKHSRNNSKSIQSITGSMEILWEEIPDADGEFAKIKHSFNSVNYGNISNTSNIHDDIAAGSEETT